MWLLEEALSNIGHNSFVLSDLSRDSNKNAKLWGEVNVLSLLFYLKERLFYRANFNIVGSHEIL